MMRLEKSNKGLRLLLNVLLWWKRHRQVSVSLSYEELSVVPQLKSLDCLASRYQAVREGLQHMHVVVSHSSRAV